MKGRTLKDQVLRDWQDYAIVFRNEDLDLGQVLWTRMPKLDRSLILTGLGCSSPTARDIQRYVEAKLKERGLDAEAYRREDMSLKSIAEKRDQQLHRSWPDWKPSKQTISLDDLERQRAEAERLNLQPATA